MALSDHVQDQIDDRGITEIELRQMLAHARRYRRSRHAGTFLVAGRMRGQEWTIAVRPDPTRRRTVVVTAFPQAEAS